MLEYVALIESMCWDFAILVSGVSEAKTIILPIYNMLDVACIFPEWPPFLIRKPTHS